MHIVLHFIIALTFHLPSHYFGVAASEKTFEVCRLNETTFLVTSYPERAHDNRDRSAGRLNEEPDRADSSPDYIDLKKAKNIPASLIDKARQNYFRTFFTTTSNYGGMKTNVTSVPGTGYTVTQPANQFNQHLLLARKLAFTLLGEARYDWKLNAKERFLDTKVDKTRRKKHAPFKTRLRKKYNVKYK